MTNGTCPSCGCSQVEGLLCHAETVHIEIALGDVRAVIEDLNVTLSKMDKMGGGGAPGLARERWAYSPGASLAADYLVNTLTTWARDVAGEDFTVDPVRHPAISASFLLLSHIPEIRRHPEVKELHEEILATVAQARAAADRPANRTIIFVGPCPELNADGDYCDGEVYAYFPIEDTRPPKMECRTNVQHKWMAMQWLRAGKRILDRAEVRKQQARDAAC